MSPNPIIWKPAAERVQGSAMHRFMQETGHGDYDALYQWSVSNSPAFWLSLCEFCGVRFDTDANTILARPDNIMDAGWFAGSQLNYAAHLLRHDGEQAAIIFVGEDGTRRELRRGELR